MGNWMGYSVDWKFNEAIYYAIWVWINTYKNTIFRGLFTSINPSYFGVHQGYQGFDPSPYGDPHCDGMIE